MSEPTTEALAEARASLYSEYQAAEPDVNVAGGTFFGVRGGGIAVDDNYDSYTLEYLVEQEQRHLALVLDEFASKAVTADRARITETLKKLWREDYAQGTLSAILTIVNGDETP